MKTFRDKVAVISGAGSGIGRYLAILLAKDGADVCVFDFALCKVLFACEKQVSNTLHV